MSEERDECQFCATNELEIDALRAENEALKEKLTDTRDALDLCRGFRMVLAEDLEIARSENMALKNIERQRWERANQAFGTNYSTEKANLMNLPLNPNDLGGDWSDLGMRRSGDF